MIGVLGGTFDPIHYGHLRPANEVMQALRLTELRLVVAARPPHRPAPFASAAQRLQMVVAALGEFPHFRIDDRELKRDGPSYTVPTLESLRAELGSVPLCLLVGSDSFAALPTWHQWQRLPALAHLVVMRRPAAPGRPATEPRLPAGLPARFVTDPAALKQAPAGLVYVAPITPLAVSATEIRAAIARGEPPPAGSLPRAVWDYIENQQLYREAA